MALAFPSTSNDIEVTESSSNLSSVPCPLPANRTPGDVLYVFAQFRADSNVSLTWGGANSPILAAELTSGRRCWLVPYSSGDPSSITATHGTAVRQRITIGRITGADFANPLDVSGATVGFGTPSVTAPAITPGVNDAGLMQIVAGTRGDAGPYTSAAGMTNLAQGTPLSASISVYNGIDYQILSGGSGVSTGSRTVTATGAAASSTTWYSILFTVKPAGGGGGGTTGQIKVYNGSSFVAKPVKVWNGSAWVTKPVKRYNGTTWVTTPY